MKASPLILCLCVFAGSSAVRAEPQPTANPTPFTLQEAQLPSFQQSILAADAPTKDLLLDADGTVWILGKTSLWRWEPATKALKKLRLGSSATLDHDQLTHLGTDGLSIFAAGQHALYQVQWAAGRVFRYPMKSPARIQGFFGHGDDFWLGHASHLFFFDRYGKTLQPKGASFNLQASDVLHFRPESKTLWIARQNQLIKLSLDHKDDDHGVITLKASQPLLGIAESGDELILHTAHAVLRVDSHGHLRSSIPVEGHRNLVRMDVTPDAHAYLFDDNLLEVYSVSTQSLYRFRVPMEGVSKVSKLLLRGSWVGLEADGVAHVFSLPDH